MRLHRHHEGLCAVITDGKGFDCLPERGCWFEGRPEEIGREYVTDQGKVFVFAADDEDFKRRHPRRRTS